MTPENIAEMLLDPVLKTSRKGVRRLVAIAGPPASGKSVTSTILARRLVEKGCPAEVVPMDGFHLDNTVLSRLNMPERKGAPQTFDASGFLRLIVALAGEESVFYPTFDRDRDVAIAGAGIVGPQCDTVLVEGNYLLFDAPVWRNLAPLWDLSIWLHVNPSELKRRLVRRWISHGLSPVEAEMRAQGNDMKNAATIARHLLPSNLVVRSCGSSDSSIRRTGL